MQLRLVKMGRSGVQGPLVDAALIDFKWHVGDSIKLEKEKAYALLAKYPGMFIEVKFEDKLRKPKYDRKPKKNYMDKVKTVGEQKS